MIGHLGARTYLETRLPPATLIYGPPSVGKWTLANHLADFHKVKPVDRWMVEHGLSIETVRLITHYAARAPHGPFKLVVARLEGSSRQALNALLKTLEEPPPTVRFLFTASTRVLPTISSRCITFEVGELNPEELEQVYKTKGLNTHRARSAAAYARGNVERGFGFESANAHRHQVITLAKSLAAGDRDGFTACFTGWDGRSSDLLTVFLTECLTQRWSTFAEKDASGLHEDRRRLWKMITALMRVSRARPRLGVRAALEPFLAR